MKNFFYACAMIVAALAAMACPMEPAKATEADPPGSVILRFETAGARTILPAASQEVAVYTASGSGPAGAVFTRTVKDAWMRLELAAGPWTVAVSGANAAGLKLLDGSATIDVASGSSVTVPINLAPASGLGAFSLSFALPANADPAASIDLVLSSADGASTWSRTVATPWAATVWEDLPAGYYRIGIVLHDGSSVRGEAEALRILPDSITAYLADFASAPGTVSFTVGVPDVSPLSPRLPSWRYWSAMRDLPLSYALSPAAAVQWYLDGQALAVGASPAVPLTLGRRELGLMATTADFSRSGSASRAIDVLAGGQAGSWSWTGAFQADPDLTAVLPSTSNYSDLAVAAVSGGHRLVAIDASSSESVVSYLHYFKVGADGNLLADRVVPARPSGTATTRMADRLALSADGGTCLAWKFDSSWAVWRRGDAVVHIDKAAIAFSTDLKIRGAALSPSGATVYLLLSATSRLVAVSVNEAGAATVWSRDLPELSGSIGSGLALGTDGRLLLISSSGSKLVLVNADGGSAWAVSSSPWLDGPIDAAPLPGGGFLVLCPAAAAVGRVLYTIDGGGNPVFQTDCPTGLSIPALSNADRLIVNPADGSFAVLGAKTETAPSLLVLCSPGGAATVFPESAGTMGLGLPTAGAWIGSTRFYCADGSGRYISMLDKE